MDKFRLTECQTLDIPVGNDVPLLVKLVKGFDSCDGEGAVPFPIDVCENVAVAIVSERGFSKAIDFTVGDGGRLLFTLRAIDVRVGLRYGIDVRGTLNDAAWHAYCKSVVKVTAATERGPQQVAQTADPYEITMEVGYVGDVVPRNISELFDDVGLVNEEKLAETLKDYAPLYSPRFKGIPFSTDVRQVDNAYVSNPNSNSPIATFNSVKNIINSLKGAANGVASLDSVGKVLAAQLNMPWRGNFEGNFQASDTEPGIWGIDNRVIGPKPLNGEAAHGVMLVFPDRYKTTIFLVGPPNGAAAGNAPEIYARRWMTGSKSWTSWLTTANFARKDDIPNIGAMSQAEAEAGTATIARLMTAKTLKAAIEHHAGNGGKDTVMPLTRIADSLTEEGIVSPDDCKQSGIYENVAFPARATSIYDATGKPYDEPYEGYPGMLIVAEIASGDEEYRSLVQMAVCEGEIAVRSIHFGLQPGSYSSMGSWRHFLSSYSLSEIFAKRIEVPMIPPSSPVTATISAASEDCSEHRIPLGVRRDFFFIAFSSVELAPADDDAEGIRHCSLQGFRFDNGDAVVRVKNSRDSIARVKVNIHAVFTHKKER